MESSSSSVNTHAAMTPEVIRDIRQRVHGPRQWDSLSHLESDKRPNLILSGKKGSFVKQRQNAFLRSTSQTSSQSSLHSGTSSSRSSLRSPTSPRSPSDDLKPHPSPIINLPRIPSKTLTERGNRPADVTKRSGEMPDDAGVKKVRRLNSGESQRSSRSSLSSTRGSGRSVEKAASNASDVVLRRVAQQNTTPLLRQDAVSIKDRSGDRPASGSSGKNVSASSSRPSSFHSRSSTRPSSSHSDRNGSSGVSTPRGDGHDVALFRRQDSTGSDRSLGDRKRDSEKGEDRGSGAENEVRSKSGSSSRRGSEGSESSSKATRHRPSFHTIQGSSTPVLQRHSVESSPSSSPRSLPPPPQDADSLPDSLPNSLPDSLPDSSDQISPQPLPSPPPMLSSPLPPLPSPPPTPSTPSPPHSPPPTPPPPPVTEDLGQGPIGSSPLFQPRPPSILSAHPLPTPPPTPKSSSDQFSQSEGVLASPTTDLPSPPLTPDFAPPSPVVDGASLSSSSSPSTPRKELGSQADSDFLNFLPDSLPHDDIGEGRHSIKYSASQAGTDSARGEMDGAASSSNTQSTAEEIQMSTERLEVRTQTFHSTTVTSSVSSTLEKSSEGEKKDSPTTAPHIFHFPLPPDYPPPVSPTSKSAHMSTSTSTSLLSPSTVYTPKQDSPSVWGQDFDHRLTSTSTDVVLGYLDNALEPYASAPPTPTPIRSAPPLSIPDVPADLPHEEQSSLPSAESAPRVEHVVPAIVMDSIEHQSSASSSNALDHEETSLEKEKLLPARADPVLLEVGRLHKKGKGSRRAKRKTAAQVTKYEGSVKTVRRQIKPGHVGELREFFIKHDDDDDDITVRHGKHRTGRSESSDNDDDAKSGYSTTSSDNEYDLEQAEKINSPDYDSASPFAVARANDYGLNWEKETASASLNTSSGDSTPKAKRSGQGYVFEKDLYPPHAQEANLTEHTAQIESSMGTLEVKNALGTSPTSLHADSMPPHSVATKNAECATAPLPFSDMQQTQNQSDKAANVGGGGEAEHEQAHSIVATTTFFSAAPALKTRSSSSESESSDTEKGKRQSGFLSSSTDSKEDLLSETTAQNTVTPTGFPQRDSNSVPSHHGSYSVAPEPGPLHGDRQIMMDSDAAVGDKTSSSVEVKGELGLTEEGGGGMAAEGGGEDPTTIFRPNDYNKNDWTSGPRESDGPAALLHAGSEAYDYSTIHSSITSGSGELGRDSIVTRTVTAQGTETSQRFDTPSLGHLSSYAFSDTRQSASEAAVLPGSDSKEKPETGATDFLSILDDIQLENDGIDLNADTALRARQLHSNDFTPDNRNSADISEIVHTTKTQTVFSSSEADEVSTVQDTSHTSAVLNGQNGDAQQSWTSEAPSLKLHSTEGIGAGGLSHAETAFRQSFVGSNGDPNTFTSTLKSSSSPPPRFFTAGNVDDTKDTSTGRTSKPIGDSPKNGDQRVKMTAVLHELTSVKQKTDLSHPERSSLSSPSSSSSLSSDSEEGNDAMFSSSQGRDDRAEEVYVYRDSRGDTYVMQDITDQTEVASTSKPTTAIVRTANDEPPSVQESLDLRRLSLGDDVRVDTKDVDVKKAREVISAFFADGSNARPVTRETSIKERSTLSSRDDHQNRLDLNSEFRVVAGNLGVSGQPYNSTLHQTNLTPPGEADQHQKQYTTVSTTSTAVVGKDSDLQIRIPRNAVPVLPHPPSRLNSRETSTDRTPALSSSQVAVNSGQEQHSFSSHVLSSSFSDTQATSLLKTIDENRDAESQRAFDRNISGSGIDLGHSLQDFESESGLGNQTLLTTMDRSFFGSGNHVTEDRPSTARTVDISRLRKASGSSLSSDEDHGGKTRYMVSRLARTDSENKRHRAKNTDVSFKTTKSALEGGRIVNSTASGKRPHVTVINTPHYNASFSEPDSLYGSQTSKATSAGDTSPTDEHLYKIVRADKSVLSSTSPIRHTSPPSPSHHTVQRTLDRKTQSTADYQQRTLNSSQEAIFRQNHRGGDLTSESWRVDRFSRNEPQLNLPLLSKSFSALPDEEDEVRNERYKLVRTAYNGQEAGSSSSESDDDSGVDGGKRYRMVSRVQVKGSKKRSNSTGSVQNASLSLRPRSPSPAREYRVSKALPQTEWDQREVDSDITGGNLYRVTRVLSSEDLPQDVARAAGNQRSWSSLRDVGDENNNKYRPFKVVHTLPTDKASPEEVYTQNEISRVHRTPNSVLHHSFDDGMFHRSKPLSTVPRTYSPGPDQHRSVINLRVGDHKSLPETRFTDRARPQYRMTRTSDNSPTYGHNQGILSPVSGYESDIERLNFSSNKIDRHALSPLRQRAVDSPFQDTPAPPPGRHYVVNSTQSSSTLEEGISARKARPRTASPPQQSPTGEWHKTTIDMRCSPSKHEPGKPQAMAPLLQQKQQSKTYVVFNSLDNIRDEKHHVTHAAPPLRRSSSQTFIPERQYRVMSPTPSDPQRPRMTSHSMPERQFRVTSPVPSDRPFSVTSTDALDGQFRVTSPVPSDRPFSVRSTDTLDRQFRVTSPVPSDRPFNMTSTDAPDRQFRVLSPVPSDRPFSMTSVDTSDRQFRVMSPTLSTSTTSGLPYRGVLSGDFYPDFQTLRSIESPAKAPPQTEDDVHSFSREVYEERTYQVGQGATHVMPEAPQPSEEEKDLRVLRGKILIQNRLDDSRDHDEFLENMNVFDTSFHLGKDNPLYQSDPDIYKSLEKELEEQEQKSKTIGQEVTQDITWETVDRIAKSHQSSEGGELSPKPRRKQKLSTMLLSKLASVDSKDLRQHIDVQHHHEEIYGDIHLVHADGSNARSEHTSNFDSVNENVELMLKKGKAFVIIKVIAERIVPIDYEFNVWRKSQAIVTRNIEIDLHATEQRRRLYEHVMETRGRMPGALEGGELRGEAGSTLRSPRRFEEGEEEQQLTSLETLRLFSQILDVTEGKADAEEREMRTQQEMGMLPEPTAASSMDLLY